MHYFKVYKKVIMSLYFSKGWMLFTCILIGLFASFVYVVLFDWQAVIYLITPVENTLPPIDYENLGQAIRTPTLHKDQNFEVISIDYKNLVEAIRSSMVHNDQNILRQGEEFLGRSLSSEEAERLLSAKSESDPDPERERRIRLVGQVVYMILCGLIANDALIGWSNSNSDGVVIPINSEGVPGGFDSGFDSD